MARYRKIDVRMWNDEKFRALSERAKLVFMFLLTCQNMTSLGAMRHTISGMAEEMKIPLEAFREAFGEVTQKGMARHDKDAFFVWLPNFLKYNAPESPNVVKSWDSQLDMLPECDMKLLMMQRVKELASRYSKPFKEALPEAFLNPEPEPEPEHEPEPDTHSPPPGVSPAHAISEVRNSTREELTEGRPRLNPADVAAIYAAYPRKIAPGPAKHAIAKALVRLVKDGDKQPDAVSWLLERTQLFAHSPAGNAGAFTPHPATWFNADRFEDDPAEWQKSRDPIRPNFNGPAVPTPRRNAFTGEVIQ